MEFDAHWRAFEFWAEWHAAGSMTPQTALDLTSSGKQRQYNRRFVLISQGGSGAQGGIAQGGIGGRGSAELGGSPLRSPGSGRPDRVASTVRLGNEREETAESPAN